MADRPAHVRRRLPVGAEALPAAGGVHFRVWAPDRNGVEVILEQGGAVHPLASEGNGYFSGTLPRAGAGAKYKYRLDGGDSCPDPASRFQPDGPHGFSQVVDPGAYSWRDAGWQGAGLRGQVIYEMHIGTFTREGTWDAARRQLRELAGLGITVVEVMPVAEFPGRFGWGYDGVQLFAPTRLYGAPDAFRAFVDHAHSLGIGVILDVVYNHLGPDGNYLGQFSRHYFHRQRATDWGDALDFDGEHSGPVREFFVANAGYWIGEFHLDGLRLDATQDMHDRSEPHILAAITARVREAACGRATLVIAENEPQDVRLLEPPERGGYGLDALWNDDFHHSAKVAMTGHDAACSGDFRGRPQELISALVYGSLYQGQWSRWHGRPRGTPGLSVAPERFVLFLDNHDQIANSARGQRCHELTTFGRYKAMTLLMLLAPGTPMLFQGQEFAASSPFLYFADHHPELAALVRQGRARFLRERCEIALAEALLPDPADPAAFARSRLDSGERRKHAAVCSLHRDLLRLRREDPVFRAQTPRGIAGAVLEEEAFLIRYFGEHGDDRLVLVNLGKDLDWRRAPEPLLAPPANRQWGVLFTTESPAYGGCGTTPPQTRDRWFVAGHAAVVLKPLS